MDIKLISLWIMAFLYVAAGINHFVKPVFYLKIMPPYLPFHKVLNYLSGLAEVILGIMLIVPKFTSLGAWGIIALLVAVFPANYYHYQKVANKGKSTTAVLIRLPFQLILIWWAYWYV